MHPNDQHFFVIGTIEDADPAAFRQTAGRAPKKIMFKFLGARLFETEVLAESPGDFLLARLSEGAGQNSWRKLRRARSFNAIHENGCMGVLTIFLRLPEHNAR
jgi:hypothetical protein